MRNSSIATHSSTEKDYHVRQRFQYYRSTQQDESQDEAQSYPMERLTSEAPPPYSEVVGHSRTVNNACSCF